jgi:hypothetical protein
MRVILAIMRTEENVLTKCNGLSGESFDENLHTTTKMEDEMLEKESTLQGGERSFSTFSLRSTHSLNA